ncbi:hypothetical protein LTS18_012802, partial [Coniosporium uncinatum]
METAKQHLHSTIRSLARPDSPSPSSTALSPPPPTLSSLPTNAPRVLIVGAGSRGLTYARAITSNAALDGGVPGIVAAVADPVEGKRRDLGGRYIWGRGGPREGEEFGGWREWVAYEELRRKRRNLRALEKAQRDGGREALERRSGGGGRQVGKGEEEGEERGVDAVVVCVLDHLHREVVEGVRHLGVHVL